MTRSLLALALLLAAGLAALPAARPTSATTELVGPILANTTLTHSGSPYHVAGIVGVAPGVTLTIEPGVTLSFAAGAGLTVNGRLVAEGTPAERIGLVADAPGPGALWNGIRLETIAGGSASLTFVDVSRAATGLSLGCCATSPTAQTLHVADSRFADSTRAIAGFTGVDSTIERTTFDHNGTAVAWSTLVALADLTIVDSTFSNNTVGIGTSLGVHASSSTFVGNQVAVSGCRCTLIGNTFRDNGTAIDAPMEASSIRYNMLTSNQIGIVARYELLFPVADAASTSAFDHNNIVANVQQNARLVSPLNHAVPDNWWGTQDAAAIDASILDGHDQLGLGLLAYQPMLPGPADVAGQAPPTFTPTATATRTPTPTPTPAPAGRPACEPRPRIDVSSVPDGAGRLRVTISASAPPAGSAADRLARVSITSAVNATVEAGQPPVSIVSSLELPARPTSTTLWVRRLDPNAATTVRLLIEDDCGQWPTFVGGGPGSF